MKTRKQEIAGPAGSGQRPGAWLSPPLVRLGCWICLAWICLVLSASQVTGQLRQPVQPAPRSLETLIGRLDSPDFRERESAERDLVQTGLPAVGQLARRIVFGSPEAAVRSLRVLERIGVGGSEQDMTRVALVLQSMANQGFPWLDRPARQLTDRWKQAQIGKTVEQLGQLGFDVNADLGQPGFVLRHVPPDLRDPYSAPVPVDPRTLDRQAVLTEIDAILACPPEDIEQRLTDELARSAVSGTDSPYGGSTQVLVEGRVVLVPGMAGGEFHSIRAGKEVTDLQTGLKLMKLLPAIPFLLVEDRALSEAGIRQMAELPGIQVVTITRCEYDASFLLEFMKQNPTITVTASGHDAFLGVSLQSRFDMADGAFRPPGRALPLEVGEDQAVPSDEEGGLRPVICRVLTVVENTAAAEAGLIPGDGILEVDDYPIRSFSEMVVIIAAKRPGDSLRLKIMHEGQERVETVVLGERPADR